MDALPRVSTSLQFHPPILPDAINKKATYTPLIVHPHFSARLVGAYGRPDVRHRSSSQLAVKEPCVWLIFQTQYLSSSDCLKNFSPSPFDSCNTILSYSVMMKDFDRTILFLGFFQSWYIIHVQMTPPLTNFHIYDVLSTIQI